MGPGTSQKAEFVYPQKMFQDLLKDCCSQTQVVESIHLVFQGHQPVVCSILPLIKRPFLLTFSFGNVFFHLIAAFHHSLFYFFPLSRDQCCTTFFFYCCFQIHGLAHPTDQFHQSFPTFLIICKEK